MTWVALTTIAILFVLLWVEKRDHRASEREWRKERLDLLQRIQAPERAVLEDFEPSNLHQYASYDDDADTQLAIEETRDGNS